MSGKVGKGDIQKTSIDVRASFDVQKTADGSKILTVRASIEEVQDSVWSHWYSKQSVEHVETWVQPALEANVRTQEILKEMTLAPDERTSLENLKTLPQFLDHVRSMEKQHLDKSKSQIGGGLQQMLGNMAALAEPFGCIVEALKDAPPFGAGQLAFGLFALVVNAAANKQKKEQTMRDLLASTFNTLPRLDAYGELYPTNRMVKRLAELYAKLLEFLREVFIYYKKPNWKGSISRTLSTMSYKDTMQFLVSEIALKSQDIYHEGIIGLSAELRSTRNLLKKVKENTVIIQKQNEQTKSDLDKANSSLEEANEKLNELQRKLSDAENHKIREDMIKLEHILVYPSYDSNELLNHITDQIQRLYRTSKQVRECDIALQDPRIVAWREFSAENDALTKPKIMWTTSKTHGNTISHIALELLKTLSSSGSEIGNTQSPMILHSLYHTDALITNQRTASTLLKEAIFQLLQSMPSLLRGSPTLQNILHKTTAALTPNRSEEDISSLERDISLTKLAQILQELIASRALPPTTSTLVLSNGNNKLSSQSTDQTFLPPQPIASPTTTPPPLFWIIDRIDTCFSTSKTYRNAPKLSDLAQVIEQLHSLQPFTFRVLMTSTCEPVSIDASFWRDDEEDEEDDKKEDEETGDVGDQEEAQKGASLGKGKVRGARKGKKRADVWDMVFV